MTIYQYKPRVYREKVIERELVDALLRHKEEGCVRMRFDFAYFDREAGQRIWFVEATKFVKEEAS